MIIGVLIAGSRNPGIRTHLFY